MRFKHAYFLFLGILSSCAPQAVVDPKISLAPKEPDYLFLIDNEPVPAKEFLYTLTKNEKLGKEKNELLTQKAFDQNLERFIHYKLKVKEAEKRGLDQTGEFKKELSIIKEDLLQPYLLKNSVQEGELRKAYNRMQEIIKVSHILTAFPPSATEADSLAVLRVSKDLKEKAENGADFNELAFKYSDDPSAQTNRGDLGYFTALQMIYPFEDAAFNLKPGQVSDPVLTSYGYHIIKQEDRRPNPGQIRVSHILIRTQAADPSSEDRAKRRIAEVYGALQSHSWEDVTLSYSEDQDTKHQGGRLPWFGVGSIVPEFEKAALSLQKVGEISAPVKTPYGYHIIKLEGTRPLSSYEEMEPALKSKILRDSRSTLIQSQVVAMQMERYHFMENEQVSEKLAPIVEAKLPAGIEELYESLSSQSLLDSALIILQEEVLSVRDFFHFIKAEKESVQTGTDQNFGTWYDKFKVFSLNRAEERDLLSNNEEYNMLAREYREGILLFSLMNDLVWQKGIADSAGQWAYYRAHLDRYQWPERVPALIIEMERSGRTTEVRKFLSDKAYSRSLKPRLEVQFLKHDPMLFTVEEDTYDIAAHPLLKKLDSSTKTHEVNKGDKTRLVILGEVIPAGPKPFEECKGKVIQDYQNHLNEELVKTLKENYIIQINEGEKERISHMVVKK